MGVKVRETPKGWFVFIAHQGQRRAIKAASKRAAEAIRDQVDARLKLGNYEILTKPEPPRPATVFPALRVALPEWIDRRERAGDIRPSTARGYRARANRWTFPHVLADGRQLGDLPVDQVEREQIGAVIVKAKTAGKSGSIVDQIYFALKGFYEELVETKVLTVNPAANLRFFIGRRMAKKAVDPFTIEEAQKILETARGVNARLVPIIEVGFKAGLRIGEILALRRGDLDWKRSTIHVQRTYDSRARCVHAPYNHETRYVDMSPKLQETLRGQCETMDLDAQVNGWDAEGRDLVFPSITGRMLNYRVFTDEWRAIIKAAKVRYRGFHATRHSFVVWLFEAGANPRYIASQTGHSSMKVLLDTYAAFIPRDHHKVGAAKVLDSIC
jgi:integrase